MKQSKKIIYKKYFIKSLIVLYFLIFFKIKSCFPNVILRIFNTIFNNIFKLKTFSSTKVCLCLICKKENLYIKEFINHYKNLGYNHIFIYDNNDIKGEKLEEIIKDEIDNEFVTIINYRGAKNKPQFRVYIDCYEKYNKKYDWLSFFDADEFLELIPKGIKIQEFLDNERYTYCQNVKFNWVLYSDDNQIHYYNKPIQERFTTPLFNNSLNNHVKSTVRGNLSFNYWKGAWNPHSGVIKYNCCSSSGEKISSDSPYNEHLDYKYGYLKHYRTKTIEEYIDKIKRGRADADVDYKDMVDKFFISNQKTKQKLDIFTKEFNISFN